MRVALGEPHQVPADEEELREAGLADDLELVRELAHDRRRQRVVPAPDALPAQLGQVAERRLALGHREAREPVALERELHPAARRDLGRRRDPLAPAAGEHRVRLGGRRVGGRQREQLGLALEVRLAVRPPQVGELAQRPAVPDRRQDVLELAALRVRVVDVVGDHDRQPQLVGQPGGLRGEPVVVGQEVVRQLEHEARRRRRLPRPEQRRVPLRERAGALAIPRPQPPRELAVATAGQRDDPFVVRLQQLVGERGHGLRPGEVRA